MKSHLNTKRMEGPSPTFPSSTSCYTTSTTRSKIEEDEEQDDLQIEEEEGAETDPTPQDDEISASGSESEATLTPPESSEAPNPSFTLEEAFSPHSELAQLSNTKRTKLVRPTKETKMLPCYGAMDEKCTLGSSCAYSHDPAILMEACRKEMARQKKRIEFLNSPSFDKKVSKPAGKR